MTNLVLNKETILKRINGIQEEIRQMKKVGEINFSEYEKSDRYKIAEYHLHRALEGVFNIGAHILSRIPGGKADEYKQVAQNLGRFNIVPSDFADNNLVKMAKYRNRLVHLYAQITALETYNIIKNNLGDFDIFLSAVKKVLEKPENFNLSFDE